MKLTIALFVFSLNVLSATAHTQVINNQSTTLLVDYYKGNQIFGSYLKIFTDGTVEISERECCPPHIETTKNVKIPQNELEWLNNLSLILQSQSLTKTDNIGNLGELYGRVIINGIVVLNHQVTEHSKINTSDSDLLFEYIRKNFVLKNNW